MPRRSIAPIVLRAFQAEAVDALAAAMLDAVQKMKAAPARRREIALRIGSALLEAPTGSGKTVMLANVAERVSAQAAVVWFWFAPFRGVVDQTVTALRAAAPGLRVRDPKADRVAIGTRPGDVFVTTWAAVAARSTESRKMRMDDDALPALDSLARQLREAGMQLGAVVDEAHHSFKVGSQAFAFFQDVLRPDLLMLATATPDDGDVEILRRSLGIERFQRVSVARDRVVTERLNKQTVKAISFVAKGVNVNLLDLNEVALRKAVEQHRALKEALKAAGVPMVPLLLVQAASASWTPGRVKEFLLKNMQFPERAVGVHTADEPDPDVQALANDPQVEALVFKMAVATGFDAPRASTLCALRPVQDKGFGLQVIGRIMRVHPALQKLEALPAAFNTGYVFLGDAESQVGLQEAAKQVKNLRNLIEITSDSVEVYIASAGDDGEITIEDERGQRVLLLTPPGLEPKAAAEAERAGVPVRGFGEPAPLFPLLDHNEKVEGGAERRAAAFVGLGLTPATKVSTVPAFEYAARADANPPKCLRTEKMPANAQVLVEELVRQVRFNAEHLGLVRQVTVEVERRETDLFGGGLVRRREERAEISDLFARLNAWQRLRVSDYIDPQDLARRLLKKLEVEIERAGQEVPAERALRRGLNVILVRYPRLCRDALTRAMGACAEVIDADDLPLVYGSDVELEESPRNLYGCRPLGLNNWENEFADWLDRQDERLEWWIRNAQVVGQKQGWGVRIMLPDTGKGYFPDFVLCVNGRKQRDKIALAETKLRTESEESGAKSRTAHKEYGRAVMVTYDPNTDRFFRVEFDAGAGRNRVGDVFTFEEFLRD